LKQVYKHHSFRLDCIFDKIFTSQSVSEKRATYLNAKQGSFITFTFQVKLSVSSMESPISINSQAFLKYMWE